MTRLRAWLLRCASSFGIGPRDARVNEEIDTHIELLTEEHVARGLPRAEARAAARRAFGGIEQTKDRWRDQRGLPFIDALRQDLRFAWRTLRRSPTFAASAILTLGLSIGANTAIFNLIDALLLKTLPVTAPDRLFLLSGNYAYPSFRALQDGLTPGVALLATNSADSLQVDVRGAEAPEDVVFVSGSYFSVLGVTAATGRALLASDEGDGEPSPVAVASHGFWQRRFAGETFVAGTTVSINGQAVTIVGVAPGRFFGERVGASPDLWVPLPMRSALVTGRDLVRSPRTAWLDLIARVEPGADLVAVGTELTHRYQGILADVFGPNPVEDERRDIAAMRVVLTPVGLGVSSLRQEFSRPLWLLMAAVALILIIACANVAGLLLARAVSRQREIGLRLALGAGRGRLVRQLVVESSLLAALGAIVGLVLAWGGRELLLRLVTPDGSRLELAVATDARVYLFVVAATAVTAIAIGLAPAWQSSRADVLAALRATPAGSRGRGARARSLLVVAQVALSLVLLVVAMLCVKTLTNLRDVDLGFSVEGQLIADVNPRTAGYEAARFADYCRRLIDRLSVEPGIVAASFSENGALMGRDSTTDRLGPADLPVPPEGLPKSSFDVVGPNYFATMKIAVVDGRDFNARDAGGAPLVMAINETMARRFFGDARALGRRMRWQDSELTIVAVTADVRQKSPLDPAAPRFYLPYFQHPGLSTLASARVILRTAGDAAAMVPAVRAAIRSVDSRVAAPKIDVTAHLVDRALARPRMVAALASLFGAIAIGLASIGLYGLLAFAVAGRTSEIGVRLALGATRPQVVWLVARRHLALVAGGTSIGLPLAVAGSSVIDSLLFGVGGSDPAMLGSAVLVLFVAAGAAAAIPAWRAVRIQPVTALRHD